MRTHCQELADREAPEERRLLSRVADLGEKDGSVAPRRKAEHGNAAGAGVCNPHRQLQEGRFARAVWPNESHDAAGGHIQREVFEGPTAPVAPAQAAGLEHIHEATNPSAACCRIVSANSASMPSVSRPAALAWLSHRNNNRRSAAWSCGEGPRSSLATKTPVPGRLARRPCISRCR